MRRLFAALLVFCAPSFCWGVDSSTFFGQAQEVSPPNPVSLKINWWEYYEVDSKTLADRRTATELYFLQVQSELSGEDLAKVQPLCEQILFGLQALIDLKAKQPAVPASIASSTEKRYTYQEWLSLGHRLLESERELQYLRLSLKLAESSYKSRDKYVDTIFAAYLKDSKTDLSKFLSGLTVMQGRVSLAIEKLQIVDLKTTIEQKVEAFSLLKEEAQHSYKRIDFTSISSEEIKRALAAAKEKEAYTYNKFVQLLDREFASQKLVHEKLDYEIARVEVVNLEIQKIIVEFMKKEAKISHRMLRDKLSQWQAIVREIRREVPDSENTTEFIMHQSLRSLALQKEDQGGDLSRQTLEFSQDALLKIQELNNALFLYRFFREQLLEMRGDLVFDFTAQIAIWWDNWMEFLQTHGKWFRTSLFKIGDFPVTPIALFKFFFILVVSFFLAKFARSAVNRVGTKQHRFDAASVYIFSRLSYYLIFILGLLIAGRAIGLDLTIFAYLAGAIAIWIGFSLQSIFHNFISGIIVLLTRSVRINDFLELDTGELGTVVDINLRTTILRGLDGRHLIIPNADLINKKFYNHTYASYLRRIQIPFRISLTEDKEAVAKVVIEAAKQVPLTSAYRDPELWITSYEDHYRKVELVVWVNGLIPPKSGSWFADYYWAVDNALVANHISIPIPERSVHLTQN